MSELDRAFPCVGMETFHHITPAVNPSDIKEAFALNEDLSPSNVVQLK